MHRRSSLLCCRLDQCGRWDGSSGTENPPDENLKAMLRRANELREAYG